VVDVPPAVMVTVTEIGSDGCFTTVVGKGVTCAVADVTETKSPTAKREACAKTRADFNIGRYGE